MMNRTLAEVVGENTATPAGHRRQALLWAATAAAVALHNAEEWLLGMTGWIAAHPWLPGRSLHGDRAEFGLVLAVVTAAVLAIAVTAIVARPPWSDDVLVCVAYALMVNGASHLLLSLLSWSAMPGVISGTVVLLPLGLVVARAPSRVRWTVSTVGMTAIAAIGVTAGGFALAALITGLG